MSALKDKYQSVGQFFKDVKRTVEDIVTRLSDVETRIDESVGGGALPQEEENGKEYKAGEGILITDDDSVVLNYNGPFAYHLDHIDTTTATTLWVTRSVGYVVRNGLRKTVYANTTPAAMASGESAWMLYNTDADSYSISIQTNAPTATSNKICVKLAENVNGVLRQIQFGEVVVVKTDGGGGGGSVGSPDYLSPLVERGDVLAQTYYPGTAYPEGQPVWLIGNLTAFPDENGQVALSVRVVIRNGGNFESVYLTDFLTQTNSYIDSFSVPVSLLIPADYEFEIDILQATGSDVTSELAIYPCI